MEQWKTAELKQALYNFDTYSIEEQENIAQEITKHFSFSDYVIQVEKKHAALKNMAESKTLLDGAEQLYPTVLAHEDVLVNSHDIMQYGFVITAGGEGERLRLSLGEQGYKDEQLKDFTKATFPIPQTSFFGGALEVNLRLIARISKDLGGYDIPVVVTTGPEGSETHRVIPALLKKNNYYGLTNCRIVAQDERFHLTTEDQIVCSSLQGKNPSIATNPDETGGPLMKLREKNNGISLLDWFSSCGAQKIIVLQGTAVYSPHLLNLIASAGMAYDGLGVGIARKVFPETDPYGTFVNIKKDGETALRIIEKNIRNQETTLLTDSCGNFLPFNTGFYVFDRTILENTQLPDYASPPKQIMSPLAPVPKIGYAATDILASAQRTAVLTIPEDAFSVIKTAEDLLGLSEVLHRFNYTV